MFSDKHAFEDIMTYSIYDAMNAMRKDEKFLNQFIRIISAETQMIGREYFYRKLKKLKPKKFREWVNVWKPEAVTVDERKEYMSYLAGKNVPVKLECPKNNP